jgi:cytochrome c553
MNASNRILVLAGGALCVLTALQPQQVLAQRSGVVVWSQTCGNCHMAQPGNRYTADQWVSILMHMRIQAHLPDAEADAVLQFLQGGARQMASEHPAAPGAVLLAAADLANAEQWLTQPDSSVDFTSYCVACHGRTGEGNGPAAAVLNPTPTNLTDPEFQDARTDAQLETVLKDGKGTMPGFGNQLTPDQIGALVSYIRSLRHQ